MHSPFGLGINPNQPDVFALMICQTAFELGNHILKSIRRNWFTSMPRTAAEATLISVFGGDLVAIF
jgi:hypothetical protein